MPPAVQHEVGVDLVAHDERAVPCAQLRRLFQLLPCPHPASGVVGTAENQHPGTRGELALEALAVHAVPVAVENERGLLEVLEEWSGDRTADEILVEVEAYTSKRSGPGAAVVTGRVNRPLETLSEEHWRERGCFLRAGDPPYGELLLAAPPWKMSGTPARWKSGCRPPGADNRDVYLGTLGMAEEEYRRMAKAGIF